MVACHLGRHRADGVAKERVDQPDVMLLLRLRRIRFVRNALFGWSVRKVRGAGRRCAGYIAVGIRYFNAAFCCCSKVASGLEILRRRSYRAELPHGAVLGRTAQDMSAGFWETCSILY